MRWTGVNPGGTRGDDLLGANQEATSEYPLSQRRDQGFQNNSGGKEAP